MLKRILQPLLVLFISAILAVNLGAIINYQGENSAGSNNDKTTKEDDNNQTDEPIDVSTGANLVQEEGLRLAAPGVPLSFDLHYNSGNIYLPGMLGRGWDISLNWQLSVIYKLYYDMPYANSSSQFGAPLEKYVSDGPLSAATPGGFASINSPPLAENWLCDVLALFGPAAATAADTIEPRCILITKYFLISDGTRKYRVGGGWQINPTVLSDWELNDGHYTEMPGDWELVHTNNEYRLLFPGKKWITFADDGRMAAMGDAWGNTVTRSRNNDVETYAHSNGRWLELDWTSNRVTEIKTDDGRGMRFSYNSEGLLASTEWYGGAKSRTHHYNYTTTKLLAERINAEGTVSRYGYGDGGRATSMSVETNWYQHTVSYGSTPQVRYYGHGTNWAEDYQYDSLGRLTGKIGPWNSSCPKGQQAVYYTYDNWRNITVERYFEGANEFVLMNSYDDHHRLLESAIRRGANTQQLFTATWSSEDRLPVSITNADGLALNFEYVNGFVGSSSLIRQGTEETLFEGTEWDSRGMPGVMRDARGSETHLEYNTDGNVTAIQPPSGPGFGFEYDAAGQVQKVNRLEPGGVTRTLAQYVRDGFGQIVNVTYWDGLEEHYLYDSMRRLIKAVDRGGRETFWEYWPIGKVKCVKRQFGPFPATVRFDYDEQGTDLKVTDELGRVVEEYALDVNGRPTTVTNILGQTMQITYAIFDLPQQIRRFDGSTVNYTYDNTWRPATIQYPDETVSMSYSAGGLLQTISDGSGTISNRYDAFSRWSGQTCPAPGGVGPYEITVVNGAGGLPERETIVAGIINYGYDPAWRVTNITAQSGGTFSMSYNPSNGLIAGMSCSAINAAYTFDALDRVTDISWKDSSNNLVRGFAYSYNSVGMVTQKVTTAYSLQSTNLYEYDSLDRLTSETVTSAGPEPAEWVVHYSYDLAGNRFQAVVNGQTINYTLSAGNRLLSWGTNGENTASYNSAGCVTQINGSGNTKVLAWDSRYRVTEIKTNGTIAEKYQYDALDRRISISDGTITNYLVYDGIHCIAETDSAGTLLKSYTYGPGIDNILSMSVYTNSGGTTAVSSVFFYIKDHLGSVQALVDSSGSIVESYQYDAWGNILGVYDSAGSPIPQSAVSNRFLWQGREYSWATRLYYFRARWYEPVTGRWLSNDPIGISGGLNQYVFCANNPVMFVDPWGLCEEGIPADVGWGGGVEEGLSGPEDPFTFVIGCVLGGGAVGVADRVAVKAAETAAGKGIVTVSRWGRGGLEPGDWVMKGGKNLWNYMRSFKWQPGAGNQFASSSSGASFKVPASSVKWPSGWGINGWWKGLFGQRRYIP